jgi:GT2 family glycosyltransferase
MVSIVIPTKDRQGELDTTLHRLAALGPGVLGEEAEVIIVDNASREPARAPKRLAGGLPITVIRSEVNHGAAARNIAAYAAVNPWLVMLDDDSSPVRGDLPAVLASVASDVAAVGGEIVLPGGGREAGGLPEVVVGCGCCVRREAFLAVGGYDATFGYYAEEYDLCAKLIASGSRVVHRLDIAFEHRKVAVGRDFARILFRLVRNNAWTIARHAPDDERDVAIDAMLGRYRAIAEREGVLEAYQEAVHDLASTLDAQRRTPLDVSGWERFTGAAAVRAHLGSRPDLCGSSVRIERRGKGDDVIEAVLCSLGAVVVSDDAACSSVIGTLSPGPMLDASEALGANAVMPWGFAA